MATPHRIRVLLVEDNLDDVMIAKRALSRTRLASELSVARDGQEALDVLFADDGDHAARPDLILLDLNLPRVQGIELLRRIRSSERIASIPVITLTASNRLEDVVASYREGANTYIQKPVKFDAFMHAVEVLGEYWIAIATLPPPDLRGRRWPKT